MRSSRSQSASLVILAALGGCSAGKLECGVGTTEVDGACVSTVNALDCGSGTVEVDGACVSTGSDLACGPGTVEADGECVAVDTDLPTLERGYYENPIVWLQKQVGQGGALGTKGAGQTHMHTSELMYREGAADRPAELFSCSYTFSVLNANDPQSMSYMAQGWVHLPRTGTRDPGCINLALDDDDPNIVYTTHHGNRDDGVAFLSGWDINSTAPDPTKPTAVVLAPVQLPMLQEGGGVSYEGLDHEGGLIYVALHEEGLGVFQRDPETQAFSRLATFEGVLANAWDVRVVGDVAYVADGPGGLAILDVSDVDDITLLGRVAFPGSAHDLAVDGDWVYVAAQSGGLVVVDASDLTAPAVVATVEVPGSAIAIDYDDGRVYLGAWNDARVYDVSDPANPAIIGGTRVEYHKAYTGDGGDRPNITDRVLGIAGKGDFLFNGTWWTSNTHQIHADRLAPYLFLPENINFLSFPGDLPPGASSQQTIIARNDGTAPLTIYDMWSDNPLFTVEPAQVRIDPGEETVLTLTFTAGAVVQEEQSIFHILSDDPGQPERKAFLVGNQTGIGVGDPLPETTSTLLGDHSGQEWNSLDEVGNVIILGYWATF